MTEPEHGLVVEGSALPVAREEPAGKLASLHRQQQIASALMEFVKLNHLSVQIQGRAYLKVEGWLFIAHQFQCTPRTVGTPVHLRNSETGELEAYQATVELVHIGSGEVMGRAVAECWLDETLNTKKGKVTRWTDKYAACSMAQTRATSKACAQAFRSIPIMAGYEGTPEEEIPPGGFDRDSAPAAQAETRDKSLPYTEEDFAQSAGDELRFGKHKGKTWGEMSEGSVGGERDGWLSYMYGEVDPSKSDRDYHLYRMVEFCLKKIHGHDALDEQSSVDESAGPKTAKEARARWARKAEQLKLSDDERDFRWREAFERQGCEQGKAVTKAQLAAAWTFLASWIPEEAEGGPSDPDWTDEGEQYAFDGRDHT